VKKWYNAVEMPNNPYAPEALKQRISGTQERLMDVPNISPSAEQKALASALTENPDPPSPKTDYKRWVLAKKISYYFTITLICSESLYYYNLAIAATTISTMLPRPLTARGVEMPPPPSQPRMWRTS